MDLKTYWYKYLTMYHVFLTSNKWNARWNI